MASTYDKASLILIPSGTKEGVVFSQKPTNGDGDFTFTRASSATRVNSEGLIEKETQNLLKYSGDLTQSQWENIRTTDVSGQTGYDGTNNAFKIIPTTDNNTHRLDYVDTWSTGQVYTFSFYAKASGYNTIDIVIGGTSIGSLYGRFNLSTGTATNSNGISASMEDLGGGWYRCQVAQISGSTTRINIGVNDGTTQTYAGDGTSGVLIQHPQLNQGLVADSYLETTTTAVYGGITDNIPRLDYTDASCPSLLLEPQRTNVILNSEYIEGWIGANTTPIANSGISPEGVNNATSITFTSGGYWYQGITLSYSVGQTFTWSIYANTETRVIEWGGATPAGTTTYEVIDSGNGWYRQILTRTMSGSGTGQFQTLMNLGYIGAGVEFKVYGAQLEEGSYATSYIPTYGASVTRVGETCTSAGNDQVINSTEGVLYAEISALANESTFRVISLKNNSTNTYENTLNILYSASTNQILAVYRVGTSSIVVLSKTLNNALDFNKVAFLYKSGDFALWINGVKEDVDTNTTMLPSGILDEVTFCRSDDSSFFYGKTKQILVFPTALTDEELADLTTI